MKELLTEFFAGLLGEAGEKKFKAKSKESGRIVPFSSQEAMDKAIKSGTHEPIEKNRVPKQPAAKKVAAKKAPAKKKAVAKPQQKDVSKPVVAVQKVVARLYKAKGTLLSGSKAAVDILEKGFRAGKGAPPGNPGSNFNENMSGEGVKILELYPDMSEEALARIIFERTRRTQLGLQQKDTSIMGRGGLPLPDDIRAMSKEEKIIYKNCVIAARSARKKFERAKTGATEARKKGFGEKYTHKVFGGAKSDLEAARQVVARAPKVFIYDEELGVVEVPKEVLLKWIAESGGGENAADTIVLTVDSKGNVVYDGWSDKKTLKDIQGNSTLNEEYTAMVTTVADLQNDGALDEDSATEAAAVLQGAQLTSESIEQGYSDVSRTLSTYFLGNRKELERYGKMAREQKETTKHYQNWLLKIQAVQRGEAKSSAANTAIANALAKAKKLGLKGEALAFYILSEVAQEGLLTADDRKILERTAAAERKAIVANNGGTLPKQHRGLDVEDSLSDLRQQVINLQRDTVKKLNKLRAKTSSGKTVLLGNLLKAREIISFLHLDKINLPKNENDHRQILRRSTQLILEGIPVSPKKLRSCLGVKNTQEFEDNFEIVFDDEDSNTVYIYAVNKEGKRVLIAKKVYRSKSGLTGATGTTIEWTKDMQRCFDS